MSDDGAREHEPHARDEVTEPASESPIDDLYVQRMQELVRRWDLATLQRDLFDAMGESTHGRSVHVPSRLALALDLFLDSYGGEPHEDLD